MKVMTGKRTRRRYGAGFKAEVVAACGASGVSVAGVTLAHGLNANLVWRWLTEADSDSARREGDGWFHEAFNEVSWERRERKMNATAPPSQEE